MSPSTSQRQQVSSRIRRAERTSALKRCSSPPSLFAGIEANPQIIGFSWFDNVATSSEDNVPITNDWRVDSDPANLVAFRAALVAGPFLDGLMPSTGLQTQLTVAH